MIPALEKRRESHKITKTLRASLVGSDQRWKIIDSLATTKPRLQFKTSDDDRRAVDGERNVVFELTIVPTRGSCAMRLSCFETVELRVHGAVTWLTPLDRCRLRNAVELFILRQANEVAKRLIVPVK